MRGRYTALSILALAGGIAGGVSLERFHISSGVSANGEEQKVLYWVAPMDPNFRRDEPGKSPMGMDLIPVYAGQEPAGDPAEVNLSKAEINAIGVRTAIARMSEISSRIDTVGFVGYNEHLTSHVHARVEGWIERLEVLAVGDRVSKGQVLFDYFAPEIAAATGDLIREVASNNRAYLEGSRSKLRSHGMSDRQIAEIEKSGEFARNTQIESPQDGVVTALNAADGMYLQPGTLALSISDLASVWLIVDVFERDIGRLNENMRAIARFEHLPGHTFEGTIDHIYPELDQRTRTLPVRLRFDNSEGLLRPGMFGSVSLIPQKVHQALTVPSEAIIRTGAAERVILKTGDGTFRPRLVTTGLRDNFGEGGRTEILQGLEPGEEVVASAQFLIDSESALSAGMMRMAPTDQEPASGTGTLVALDPNTRVAEIRHDRLESLDWPAMTSEFPIRADISLDRLREGEEVMFRMVRGADGLLGLIELGPDDGIAATGTGMALSITPDGKLTLKHDPIPELGWPAMQMDMPVSGIAINDIPLDAPIEFDLAKDDGNMFTIVAVRSVGSASQPIAKMPAEPAATQEAMAEPIIVTGTIDTVDAEAKTATITHGPIVEIGMPGMTMDFSIDPGLEPRSLATGEEMSLTFSRPDGLTMVLSNVEPVKAAMKVSGRINEVKPDERMANITHGPLVDIGMPGMTMDFTVDEMIDPSKLPIGTDLTLLLRQNPDFSLTLVGISSEQDVGQ